MKTVYGSSKPGCRRTGGGERLEQICHFCIEHCEGAMQRWRWISLFVAVLALALSGCGSGGGISMGGPNGDDSETSLLDKWQQFEDDVPTLRMTSAQVFEAWRSAARQSTHRVFLAGPVSIGSDPASPIPVETYPAFPVDAEACSPGDCDTGGQNAGEYGDQEHDGHGHEGGSHRVAHSLASLDPRVSSGWMATFRAHGGRPGAAVVRTGADRISLAHVSCSHADHRRVRRRGQGKMEMGRSCRPSLTSCPEMESLQQSPE